jgi:uncharacterized protein YndB with AHSA1/START domain
VTIRADATAVWRALTDPALMRQWAAEPELDLEIVTDWQVGRPIVIKGFHHVRFENHGTVLHFEPNTFLQYTHLSSISRLPDRPENYTRIAFRLGPSDDGETTLNLELENFPTESILRHLTFYWLVTIEVLKQFVEASTRPNQRNLNR